jgi:AcrR family transcriptional regulator
MDARKPPPYPSRRMQTIENALPPVQPPLEPDCPGRREKIVTAADGLIGECGLDGLTVRALLKRTGLARRAFYEGFSGKDELVLAVFERVLKSAADHFVAKFETIGDPLECIHYFVHNIVIGGYETNEPSIADRRGVALSREHMRLAEARPAELALALRPLLACLTDQVERGIRSGQLREADPELQAALIYNLMAATTHVELLRDDPSHDFGRREKLAEAIWQFCRHAIIA